MSICVLQGSPDLLFRFNFVTETIVKIVLSSYEEIDADVSLDR